MSVNAPSLYDDVTCQLTLPSLYDEVTCQLTPSVRDPPGRGGSWQPADVRTPLAGGSLYATVFAPLMIKFSGLLHPFIR